MKLLLLLLAALFIAEVQCKLCSKCNNTITPTVATTTTTTTTTSASTTTENSATSKEPTTA
ncbi:maker90, partial [Drosophila busckii]